ncbi:hypothetical protein OXPF_09550 [Oxobacter pfennigii]|uniref:Phospholipase D-like domain-containing protein n=1 Tax=Oxobacter pfennigii TaxID=36849 RepID=A0A0P8WSY0_9CLOT|nr:hypothetical protein [Oxobacter pfennigii]KPU45722.1 hypothetical protein OXPF_09550 [Oxobacter pfennigii]
MEGLIQYISDINQFKEAVLSILGDSIVPEILISGIYTRMILGDIIDKIIEMNNGDKCKIIISNIINREGLSKSQIRKLYTQGGKIKINSNASNNIIIIGNNAFVLSYSYKYNRENGPRTSFESCILTDCSSVVDKVKEVFLEKWGRSFPLAVENAGEDNL